MSLNTDEGILSALASMETGLKNIKQVGVCLEAFLPVEFLGFWGHQGAKIYIKGLVVDQHPNPQLLVLLRQIDLTTHIMFKQFNVILHAFLVYIDNVCNDCLW